MTILSSRGVAFHSPTPAPATGNRLHSRPCYGTIGSSVPGVSILHFRCRGEKLLDIWFMLPNLGHFHRMPSSLRVGFCSKSDFGDGSASAVKYKIVPVNFLRAGDRPHGFCGMSMSMSLRVDCCSKIDSDNGNLGMVKDKSVSVVLLAGGSGKRMGASIPKQYLPLLGQPIALYSFYIFSKMSEVKEIVVVCDPSYKDVFEDAKQNIQVGLKFALPGKERQDSVYNGLQQIDWESELVCIHDSARPLVLRGDVEKVLKDGYRNGAAVLGVPVKATIKEADSGPFVVKTLDRRTLWEMQTPQVIKPRLLQSGFELVNREGLEVTDDVSIVEHLKHPVYITEGSYTNIKVTTPDDLLLAERILNMGGKVPGAEEILNMDAKVPAS